MAANNAFVTGGTGFLGLNLVEQLTAQGWQVTALHRPSSDLVLISRFPVDLVAGDLLSQVSLRRAIPEGATAAFLVLEGILDVAHRTTPRQHLDGQILQRLAVALQMGPQLGAKGRGPAGNLRRRIVDEALGRLQTPLARAVAITAAGLRPMLVVVTIQSIALVGPVTRTHRRS